MKLLNKGSQRQLGQGMTEYIIIVALIAIAAITAFTLFGNVVRTQLSAVATELSGQDGEAQITSSQDLAGQLQEEGASNKNMGSYNNATQGGGGGGGE